MMARPLSTSSHELGVMSLGMDAPRFARMLELVPLADDFKALIFVMAMIPFPA